MPHQQVFCNVPWTNTHVYWDGTFGMCCAEQHRPHDSKNLQDTNIVEWYNSNSIQDFRSRILSNQLLSECTRCYREESMGAESRRIKENFKSVIFTEQAFDRSFHQSPSRDSFVPNTNKLPVDWHIDLGNECNLACKMCSPNASSKIDQYYRKWQLTATTTNSNWTLNEAAWNNFLVSIDSVPNLHRLHFMGGEPTMSKRFRELLTRLVNAGRTNISISFVTNGTLLTDDIVDLVLKFDSADIEISIESVDPVVNGYIRQGKESQQTMVNIEKLLPLRDEKFNVVLRPVPQLLSISRYDQYISYALKNSIPIQSIAIYKPEYFKVSVLPKHIRKDIIKKIQAVKDSIEHTNNQTNAIHTGRNVHSVTYQMERECDAMIALLNEPSDPDVETQRHTLVEWLLRWDRELGLNALDIYPEYRDFLVSYGYVL